MRPRLLDDVRYVECQEGVYIENGLGSCILEGRQVHRWIEALAPRLSGDRDLAEITHGLPDAHREMVEELVRTLAERRFVVDARDDRAHDLSARELTEYAPELAFIRYAYDSAEWRFQQVRNARILLYGRGPVLAAVAEDGLRSGWRRLRVLTPDADDAALHEAARGGLRDDAQQVRVEEAGPDPAADPLLHAYVAGADLVVHVASGEAAEELATVARLCADADVALTQALVRDTDAWATPIYERDHALAESGWRWLAAGATGGRRPGVPWLTGPVPSLIAAGIVLRCFRHLAQMRPERPDTPSGARMTATMTRVDLETLDTSVHRFHRHPAGGVAPDDAATRDMIASLSAAGRVPQRDLLERASTFEDPYLGPLRSLDEEDLPQVPLALCRATVIDPYGGRPSSAVAPVVGWGPDRETAQVRAVLAALAAYGSLVAGHVSRHDGGEGLVWGQDLLTGSVRRVPLPSPIPAAEDTGGTAPIGVAAGLSWAEAVEAGLLAHFEALPILGEHDDASRVDPLRQAEDDGDVLDTLRLLERTGEAFEFHDHSAAVGLPAYTVTLQGDVVARSVAAARVPALRHAARHALLSWQTRAAGRPEAVPATRRWASDVPPPTAEPPPAPARLASRLSRVTGRTPVAVPLARDDVLSSLLPFVVQVVLCDD